MGQHEHDNEVTEKNLNKAEVQQEWYMTCHIKLLNALSNKVH